MTLIILALSGLYLAAIATDVARFIIPNRVNLAIAALYPLLFLIHPPEPWWGGLAAASIMLVLGMGIFATGIMGGGDVKLLTVSLLWTGWSPATPTFLFVMALAGGALAIVVILMRRVIVPLCVRLSPGIAVPRIFMPKQPIPYGVAIAVGFLFVLYRGMLPGVTL